MAFLQDHEDQWAPHDVDCSLYDDPYLNEEDSGRELRLVDTGRFGICLDESLHPFAELDVTSCPIIGYVSNWSAEGPRNYPIGFEVVGEGSCIIRHGDFWIRVVGVPWSEMNES